MKQYKDFIVEFALLKSAIKSRKNKRDFDKAVEEIEDKYPGVNFFFRAASEWGHEVSKFEDAGLYSLLNKLSNRKSIRDLNDHDLRMVYKFIIKRGLRDYDDFEALFIGASEND